MDVHLTPELERLVENRIQSGGYGSASEVVYEALRLLEQRDKIDSLIGEGWQAAQRGELISGDEIFDRIESELAAVPPSGRR